jgi:hypothetical protein
MDKREYPSFSDYPALVTDLSRIAHFNGNVCFVNRIIRIVVLKAVRALSEDDYDKIAIA